MPKIFKVSPKPEPLPPATYSIEGLSKSELVWLYSAVRTRSSEMRTVGFRTGGEMKFLLHMEELVARTPESHPEKE